VVSLAEQVLRVPVSDDFGSWLHASTRGHPLFVIAMMSDLVGRGVLTVGQPDPRPPVAAPVPAHVREALQQRIAALGARVRRAVDVGRGRRRAHGSGAAGTPGRPGGAAPRGR
jgi:hypothetical protein